MKKPRAKKKKGKKQRDKKARARRRVRIKPHKGPFQIELPLQMPLFGHSLDVHPRNVTGGSADGVDDIGTNGNGNHEDDDA